MHQTEKLHCAERASELLKAFSNKYRLLILCELSKKNCTIDELSSVLDTSHSNAVQHLWRLQTMGLVRTRKQAGRSHYSLATVEAARMVDLVEQLHSNSGGDFRSPLES